MAGGSCGGGRKLQPDRPRAASRGRTRGPSLPSGGDRRRGGLPPPHDATRRRPARTGRHVVSEQGADADRDVLEEVERLIAALQSHSDPAVREQVGALLQGIDAVHRIGLSRLVAGIQSMAGEAFVHRLCADPAIRLLLMSYGLVAVNRRLQAEEALDAVRGHLHAGGVDVELCDVVGSVVYVRLHGRATVDEAAVRHDLEEALHDGLLGFQELVIGERETQRPAATVIPASNLKRVQRPVYRRALAADALAPGPTAPVALEGQSL